MCFEIREKIDKQFQNYILMPAYIFDDIAKLIGKPNTHCDTIERLCDRVDIPLRTKPVICDHARGNPTHFATGH